MRLFILQVGRRVFQKLLDAILAAKTNGLAVFQLEAGLGILAHLVITNRANHDALFFGFGVLLQVLFRFAFAAGHVLSRWVLLVLVVFSSHHNIFFAKASTPDTKLTLV